MQVILLERIEKLGQMGDVVNVKPGYARNYLLPEKKAMRATEENRRYFAKQRVQLEAVNLERREEAQAVAAKMTGLSVTLIRQAGEAGQLYGSVGARDIADAMLAAGFEVSRKQVKLAPPIKTVGIHDVRVDLHAEVAVTVKANIARSPEEAEIQAKTGEAVVREEERPVLIAEEEAPEEEAEAEAEAEAGDEAKPADEEDA
ncbi:50S ribosomal protein L9 [Shumkonia mesophila]|uniref:50S ribosomal protein L9 n=1 Tax=Shumkonia mesophila TaxID=2838854 RepID=UPI002934425E|nr:50S ribosomal protein L9 [Shumkonia mesophila]